MLASPVRPRHAVAPARLQPRRRWPRRLTAALVTLAVVAAAGGYVVTRYVNADADRNYLAADGWPARGEAAYAIDDGAAHAGRYERPVPIASLAKVMTALVVLYAHPLTPGAGGPILRVDARDVRDLAHRRRLGESVVAVRAGERLTERQALDALLLPSANNVAALLARWCAGSVPAFVDAMNAEARRLGMTRTHYTDPSGFADTTVSTAADQLRLGRAADADATLRSLTARRSAVLPVAGTVHNTDLLLGSDGFVGTKTGSDDAAGGCFLFRAIRRHDGRRVTVIGVVLGQQGRHPLTAGLFAARQWVLRLAP